MAEVAKKRRWTVYGRVFNRPVGSVDPPTIEPEKPLTIEEDATTLIIPNSEGPYGEPLSTGVAVHLIRNMYDIVKESNKVIDKIQDKLSPNKKDDDPLGFFLTPEELETLEFLKKLIRDSMAITFDKSQILRLISQPGCEGIRFYQALRVVNDKKVMTLVAVGLNRHACDLNYATTNDDGSFAYKPNDHSDDTCQSLVLDWAHPPGGTTGGPGVNDTDKWNIDPMFVLLKLAEAAKVNKKEC